VKTIGALEHSTTHLRAAAHTRHKGKEKTTDGDQHIIMAARILFVLLVLLCCFLLTALSFPVSCHPPGGSSTGDADDGANKPAAWAAACAARKRTLMAFEGSM
jgi:hypothetical protein